MMGAQVMMDYDKYLGLHMVGGNSIVHLRCCKRRLQRELWGGSRRIYQRLGERF